MKNIALIGSTGSIGQEIFNQLSQKDKVRVDTFTRKNIKDLLNSEYDIVICAAEDVGLADPQALVVANAAAQASHMVGLPEARIILSEAAVYVALAPKSNSAYLGIDAAIHAVRHKEQGEVPKHLRDAHYGGAKQLGHGVGYRYAQDYPNGYVEQQYLPDTLVGETFYTPLERGCEGEIVKAWKTRKG